MKAISVVLEKANVVAVPWEKSRYSGFLNEMGKVYIIIAPNAQSATLLPIIRENVKPDGIVYTDTFRSMMCLMSVNLAIFASITARILLKIITT